MLFVMNGCTESETKPINSPVMDSSPKSNMVEDIVLEDVEILALEHLSSFMLPEGTHRPEILFNGESLYILVVDKNPESNVVHRGYIFDASNPDNIDFEDFTTFDISEKSEIYGEGADHRSVMMSDEILVVHQSNVMDEEKEGQCKGGPQEACQKSQHLLFSRFDSDGKLIFSTEIASTLEFEEDNYPDMSILPSGDNLLVSTGTKDNRLKIREIDMQGKILETYTYKASSDTIPGSIGNSMFWGENGDLLVFSSSMTETSITVIDSNFEVGEARYFDLPDDESTFQTGVLFEDGHYIVGHSGRESGELNIKDNPLSPRLMILDKAFTVVETIVVSDKAGSGHVHPTMVILDDELFYTWSSAQSNSPQVYVEVYELSKE